MLHTGIKSGHRHGAMNAVSQGMTVRLTLRPSFPARALAISTSKPTRLPLLSNKTYMEVSTGSLPLENTSFTNVIEIHGPATGIAIIDTALQPAAAAA